MRKKAGAILFVALLVAGAWVGFMIGLLLFSVVFPEYALVAGAFAAPVGALGGYFLADRATRRMISP